MGESQEEGTPPATPQQAPGPVDASPPPLPASHDDPSPLLAPRFDPRRMIGIIRRKALIKDLAAVYHAQCLAYSQELLELQRNWEEPCTDLKAPDFTRKEPMRPTKRLKKSC